MNLLATFTEKLASLINSLGTGRPVRPCRGVDTGTGPSPPVASASRFVLSMPQSGTTSAGVYDSAGRLIRTLWSGEALAPGEYVRFWDKRTMRRASPRRGRVRGKANHSPSQLSLGTAGARSTIVGWLRRDRSSPDVTRAG
jgi:hypothetical protein